MHEYPFRDEVWVEDLGRQVRRIEVRGFIIENSRVYGGGDVIAQREKMLGAAETRGSGTLVHPSLGRLQVSLINFVTNARADLGRVFELVFVFLETGKRIFPSSNTSTAGSVLDAADAADAAASGDFVTSALADLEKGAAVVDQALKTAQSYAQQVETLAGDATALYHVVTTLPGSFGRYFSGRNVGGLSGVSNLAQGGLASVSGLINAGTIARSSVAEASDEFISLTGGLGI